METTTHGMCVTCKPSGLATQLSLPQLAKNDSPRVR